MPSLWNVPAEWPGETVFIVAGGPSFEPAFAERLRGRRVIVINSAWRTVPFADFLLFTDARWWGAFAPKPEDFPGRVVTTTNVPLDPHVLRLKKVHPPGLASKRTELVTRRTSVSGAINLAVHLGAARIPLFGVDGQLAQDGRRHHHGEKYPWGLKAGCFEEHAAELATLVPDLRAAGVEVVNANTGSAVTCFPFVEPEDAL